MKSSLLFVVLSLIINATVPAGIALAQGIIGPPGSQSNPIYIQPTSFQAQQNFQNQLIQQYGYSAVQSCSSRCPKNQPGYLSSQDSANPNVVEQQNSQCNAIVLSCLKNSSYVQQPQTQPSTSGTCGVGHIEKNGVCMTNDTACKATFGAQSYFGGRYIVEGVPACDCKAGYEIKDGFCAAITMSTNQVANVGAVSISVASENTNNSASYSGYGTAASGGLEAQTSAYIQAASEPMVASETSTTTGASSTPPASKTTQNVVSILGILLFMAGVLRFLA